MSQTILIIDDEKAIRKTLSEILSFEGFVIDEAADGVEGVKKIKENNYDCILCDIKMPKMDGMEVLEQSKELKPDIPFIVISGHGNIETAVEAVKKGAFDFISKPPDLNRLLITIRNAMDKKSLVTETKQLRKRISKGAEMVGESEGIQKVRETIEKVAPTDARVLVTGENGVGKELVARRIHELSPRANGPLIEVNCAAIPSELIESELFGHAAGAFTGAVKNKKGLLEEADGGTLFLDEIGEMSPDLQAKMLRVLESGEYIRVGETKVSKVDLRLIAATHRDLQEEIKSGTFREDLYYRISVFKIALPALRERTDDIPLIAQTYLEEFNIKSNQRVKEITGELKSKLQTLPWKGNVRELKNVMERMVILAEGESLTESDLPFEYQLDTGKAPATLSLDGIEKNHIQKVLHLCKGNKAEAAKMLNIGLTTLYRKIDEYQLA